MTNDESIDGNHTMSGITRLLEIAHKNGLRDVWKCGR